jgi:hypothetical protein
MRALVRPAARPDDPARRRVPADQVVFQPHSFADPGGRLFTWRGELWRGLRGEAAQLLGRLLADGSLERLSERGLLIETTATDLELVGFDRVVAHRRLPFVSYPQEWPALMLQQAALLMLQLARELALVGLTLKDAHPWNVLFDGCLPRWVDLTSIVPASPTSPWPARDEFERFCLNPLLMLANGQGQLARLLICEPDGVQPSDLGPGRPATPRRALAAFQHGVEVIAKRLPAEQRRRLSPTVGWLAAQLRERRPGAERTLLASLETLTRQVASLDLGRVRGPAQIARLGQPHWPLERLLARTLTELNPRSILAVGAPAAGLVTGPAAPARPVVVFDRDERHLTALYHRGQAARLPLLPLLIDFSRPTSASGLLDHWLIGAPERLRCDLVLAPGLIEELVDRRGLGFEHLAAGLRAFADRFAMVDYGPDRAARDPAGAELTALQSSLRQRFERVEVTQDPASAGCLLVARTQPGHANVD